MEKEYPHDFITGNRDAKYPYLCRKCGKGLDKYTINKEKVEPCPYPDAKDTN